MKCFAILITAHFLTALFVLSKEPKEPLFVGTLGVTPEGYVSFVLLNVSSTTCFVRIPEKVETQYCFHSLSDGELILPRHDSSKVDDFYGESMYIHLRKFLKGDSPVRRQYYWVTNLKANTKDCIFGEYFVRAKVSYYPIKDGQMQAKTSEIVEFRLEKENISNKDESKGKDKNKSK